MFRGKADLASMRVGIHFRFEQIRWLPLVKEVVSPYRSDCPLGNSYQGPGGWTVARVGDSSFASHDVYLVGFSAYTM
jgi:hypothetical protein